MLKPCPWDVPYPMLLVLSGLALSCNVWSPGHPAIMHYLDDFLFSEKAAIGDCEALLQRFMDITPWLMTMTGQRDQFYHT